MLSLTLVSFAPGPLADGPYPPRSSPSGERGERRMTLLIGLVAVVTVVAAAVATFLA